jgi:hypothetical protein
MTLVAIMVMVLAVISFAGTINGTTAKNTQKTVSITNSPYNVSISYDYGTILPYDDARIYGEATASANGHYVRLHGEFTGYSQILDKTQSDSTAPVSVSGTLTYDGVDQAVGSGYAEARTDTSPASVIAEKVTLTITN